MHRRGGVGQRARFCRRRAGGLSNAADVKCAHVCRSVHLQHTFRTALHDPSRRDVVARRLAQHHASAYTWQSYGPVTCACRENVRYRGARGGMLASRTPIQLLCLADIRQSLCRSWAGDGFRPLQRSTRSTHAEHEHEHEHDYTRADGSTWYAAETPHSPYFAGAIPVQ